MSNHFWQIMVDVAVVASLFALAVAIWCRVVDAKKGGNVKNATIHLRDPVAARDG